MGSDLQARGETAALASSIHIVPAQRLTEGAGFVVHRPFPVPGIPQFDPILLVDEMGPVEYKPGEAKGHELLPE